MIITGYKILGKPSSLKHDGNHLCQGKQSLNHGLPKAACQGRMGLHMLLILLLSSLHPSQLLLETGDASSQTHKGCTYLLLPVCAQALC